MTYNTQLPEYLELGKATPVHLTANGEMCNRLARGTRIIRSEEKGIGLKFPGERAKKKGWIFFPNPSIKNT